MGQEARKKMRELRTRTGMTQKAFAEYFNIPYDTYQKWELGSREYPPYVYELMQYKAEKERLYSSSTHKGTDVADSIPDTKENVWNGQNRLWGWSRTQQ